MREKTIAKAVSRVFNVSKGRAKYSTIRDRVSAEARIDGIHLCQLIAAMVIASVGLNTNSTEAIIGAMLICPLMGSVLGCAYAVATMDRHLLRHSVVCLATECAICLVTSTLYFFFSPLRGTTSELLSNSSATIWDVLVALVGGFAGALGLSRRKEPTTLISGVAVATALIPPLCAVGYGLADNNAILALSALYEFLINVFFIGFGSAMVFIWLRVPLVVREDGSKASPEELAETEHESHALRKYIMLGLLVFAVPCLYFSIQVINQRASQRDGAAIVSDAHDTVEVTRELQVVCPGFVSYHVSVEDYADDEVGAEGAMVQQRVVATVQTRARLGTARKREVEALIALHVADLDEVTFEVVGD